MGNEKFGSPALTREEWEAVWALDKVYAQWAKQIDPCDMRVPNTYLWLVKYPRSPHYQRILHEFTLWRATQRLLGEDP